MLIGYEVRECHVTNVHPHHARVGVRLDGAVEVFEELVAAGV